MNEINKQNLPENEQNISTLINQIHQKLISIREDDMELTDQLTSLYENLCQLRHSLTNQTTNSNNDISTIPIYIDSSFYPAKPRSDSEPNTLADRQRIVTIVEDLK